MGFFYYQPGCRLLAWRVAFWGQSHNGRGADGSATGLTAWLSATALADVAQRHKAV